MSTEEPSHIRLATISPAGNGPLYQQIIDAIKKELSEGRLEPGSSLPSFRALAEELLVSVITVKRAYEELEQEGILVRRQGLGTFISPNGAARSREVKKNQAEALLREAVQEGREAGLSTEEIQSLIQKILKEESSP